MQLTILSKTTGGPSSSCEMIILRNNGHGGIIRVCMGIFTTALRNKKIRGQGFSYVRWKPWNEQLAQMGSFHQSKRSDNKQYAVEARWGIFFWEFDVFFYSLERS